MLGDDVGVTTVGKTLTLDASNYNGTLYSSVTGSGAATISMGGVGNFSGSSISASASSAVFDFSTYGTCRKIDIAVGQCEGAMTTTLGSGSGIIVLCFASAMEVVSFTMDGTRTGDLTLEISASGGTVTLRVVIGDGNSSQLFSIKLLHVYS